MCCYIVVFDVMGGVLEEIFYDCMKIVVIGEDEVGIVMYNILLVVFFNYYGMVLKVCCFYRVKMKGKVEWLFWYICQDFFLVCSFRNFDDFNVQFMKWWELVVNLCVYVMIDCVVDEVFVEERLILKVLLVLLYSVVFIIEWWVSYEGMILVDGNYYSVLDMICWWILEVQNYIQDIWIFEDGIEIVCYLVLEGKNKWCVDFFYCKVLLKWIVFFCNFD